jgi:hypothetical protein
VSKFAGMLDEALIAARAIKGAKSRARVPEALAPRSPEAELKNALCSFVTSVGRLSHPDLLNLLPAELLAEKNRPTHVK